MEYINYLVRCTIGRMYRKGTQQQKMCRRDDWKEHIQHHPHGPRVVFGTEPSLAFCLVAPFLLF